MTEFTMDDAVYAVIFTAALAYGVAGMVCEGKETQKNQIQQIDSTEYVQKTDTMKTIQMQKQR